MIKRIKTYLVMAIMPLLVAAPMLMPVSASACKSNIADQLAQGAKDASGDNVDCGNTGVGPHSLGKIGKSIVDTFSIIIGIIAVIMIIYGGFRYITSGGSAERVGAAKNILIYAIIGLIIVALAQLIVHFVLFTTDQAIR